MLVGETDHGEQGAEIITEGKNTVGANASENRLHIFPFFSFLSKNNLAPMRNRSRMVFSHIPIITIL